MNNPTFSMLPIEDLANVTGGAGLPVAKPLAPPTQADAMLQHGGTVKNGIWSAGPKSVGGIAVSTIPGVVAF